MKTEHMEYFVKAAEACSLNKVAEEYYTSHQVIRKAIKNLETELNVQLIKTNNKGLELTTAGKIMLKYAKKMQRDVCELKTELAPHTNMAVKDKQKVELGITPYLTDSLLLDFVDDYQRQKKDISIKIKSLPLDEMYDQLTNEQTFFITPTVDFALNDENFQGKLKEHKLTFFTLKTSSLYICAHENSKYAALDFISDQDFARLPVFISSRTTLNSRFALNGNQQIISSLVAQKGMIKKGLGVSLVTQKEFEFYFKGEKQYRIIPTALAPVTYICVHRQDMVIPGYVNELLNTLREVL